jgi:hypothetical protein
MKNLLFLSFIITLLTSCLYKNGPVFSFKLKSERIANKWIYDNYAINNLDVTSSFESSTIEFTKDGYIYKESLLQDSIIISIGKWEFDENTSKILKMYLIDSTLTTWGESWTILKLKEEEIWLENRGGNEIHELTLKPAP